jgi:hypothetical protein
LLGLGMVLCVAAFAQQPADKSPRPENPVSVALTPPKPVPGKPPVALFRDLLAMPPVERREFLANRSPEARKLIQAKINEYEELSPESRELRLEVTELRWYLLPLLSLPATNRTAQLSAVPDLLRGLIDARLQEWDKLAPQAQKELLDHEPTVRFYFELAARTPQQRAQTVTNLPAAVQEKLEAGVRRWQSLADNQRSAIVRNFYQFFDLTPAEKEKTLRTLSEPERLQIEKTLSTFGSMPAAQRAQCLHSFEKFASLSPEERQQFLKSAELWERMSPTERQSWRNLVSSLSHLPPLPPGLGSPPRPPTPIPSALNPTQPPATVATNLN